MPRGSWGGSSSLSDLAQRFRDFKGHQAGEPAGFVAEKFEMFTYLKTAKALGLGVAALKVDLLKRRKATCVA